MPGYTPVQQIVERSRTLFFSFQNLDSTKPTGLVTIRVEIIAHYLERYAGHIIERKKAAMALDSRYWARRRRPPPQVLPDESPGPCS